VIEAEAERGRRPGSPPIPDKLFFRIGEVADLTGVPPYVLRYWESEFKLLRPRKNHAGQRIYRKHDMQLVLRIKGLLYEDRLTLEGAKKRLHQEARARTQQLELPAPDPQLLATLRGVRARLEGMRQVLRRPSEIPLEPGGGAT
jgi:DNA-binding transcriptional MerR regulator